MNKYDYCICDMDGTLLNHEDKIGLEDKKALEKLQSAGVNLVLATGRVDLMVRKYIDELNVSMPVISCNGALIRDWTTNEILYSRNIENNIALEIAMYLLKSNIHFMIYTTDMVYGSLGNPRMLLFERMNEAYYKGFEVPISVINEDLSFLNKLNILKVLIVAPHEEVLKLKDYFQKKYSELSIVSSNKGLLDIMANNISKGEALKHLAKAYNMNLKRCIAFGDNYNDISMFQEVGLSIAVGNAEEKVKNHATCVTLSNTEGGVAYAVNNIIEKY